MSEKESASKTHANGSTFLSIDAVAAAWSRHAEDNARWVLARLVVRRDVWGGYVRADARGATYTRADGSSDKLGATLTHPSRSRRGKVLLTDDVVIRHFRPRHAGDIIGLHTTSPDNTCRWGGIDIDRHGEHSSDPAANWLAARHWFDRLVKRGFRPLLTDSNGVGGYHLHVLLAEDIFAPRMYYFLRGLVADYANLGLPAPPETFPKQAQIKPGKYGNWMRVPGRHHSREHWARVWDGSRWLEGEDAIAHILVLTGDPPDLLPENAELDARVRAYLARLPRLAEGQGRDDVAFNLLAWLARDMGLGDEQALRYAEEWDAGNTPPKGRTRLQEILANVHEYGQRDYGSGLTRPTPDTTDPQAGDDDRPAIVLTVEESEVNAQAVEALARDPGIYQRAGLLVRVVRDASPAARGVRRPYARASRPCPRRSCGSGCRPVPTGSPSERAGPACNSARAPAGLVHRRRPRPRRLATSALPRGRRRVSGAAPDGSVLSRPGYDADTGLLLEVAGGLPAIPDHLSQEDAVAARDLLLKVLVDFPLARPIYLRRLVGGAVDALGPLCLRRPGTAVSHRRQRARGGQGAGSSIPLRPSSPGSGLPLPLTPAMKMSCANALRPWSWPVTA